RCTVILGSWLSCALSRYAPDGCSAVRGGAGAAGAGAAAVVVAAGQTAGWVAGSTSRGAGCAASGVPLAMVAMVPVCQGSNAPAGLGKLTTIRPSCSWTE